MIKNIGIAVDDYKVEYFKKKLEKAGYDEYRITKLTERMFLFSIRVPEESFPKAMKEVQKLVSEVQIHFNQSN